MTDNEVRARLEHVIQTEYEAYHGKPMPTVEREQMASAILARFDLVEKPVVTADALGLMVSKAAGGHVGWSITVGRKMLDQPSAGLTIVRVEEAAK